MAEDVPIRYIERTHTWYRALGYETPYRYAHFADVPFQPLRKPLAQCTATLVTTAAPFIPGHVPAEGAYDASLKFFQPYTGDTATDPDLRITHVAIDRRHAVLDDPNCWFPLPAMRESVREGRIGALARRFHGMPTHRSQRHTAEADVPLLVERCREDAVDVAVLVPNCPVCHQTLSMAARALEAAGIATVVMGSAKDIVEHAGVPRFLFSDFPLGNAAGKPHDPASQRATLELAYRLLESAPAARTTVQSPQRWADSPDWKLDYSNAARCTPAQLAEAKEAFEAAKRTANFLRAGQPR